MRARVTTFIARRTLVRRATTAAGGQELLHTSRIPTRHFQDSLPKLPIPQLEDSLVQLHYFASAIATPDELEELSRASADFAAGDGPRLQAKLVAQDAAKYSSFISKPWFDLYLRDRRSLLLNYNPQLTFKDEPTPTSQASRAARLAHAATTFLRTLEREVLEPDIFHTNPARSKQAWWPEVMRMVRRAEAEPRHEQSAVRGRAFPDPVQSVPVCCELSRALAPPLATAPAQGRFLRRGADWRIPARHVTGAL